MASADRDPLSPPAAISALVATAIILAAVGIAALVRLLPWVLDPSIAWTTLAPFAKSLLSVGFEAALLTGWPVGWALATQRLVERGEARVLASLGERPLRTVGRLAPQALGFAAILVASSLVLARDARAPGRVVNALLTEGRAACAAAQARADRPSTKGVPFVSATWVCAGGTPRLVGRSPISAAVFTAEDASVSDDLRRIDLTRARLGFAIASGAGSESPPTVRLRVDELVLRGLAPWARASSLPPVLRAAVVAASAIAAAWCAAILILRARRRRIGGVAAAAIGATGPLTAIAALRALELRVPEVAPGGWLVLFALVPALAAAAVLVAAAIVTALPEARGADSK
jgi:hypothetical protein